jgi:hypothetical protein
MQDMCCLVLAGPTGRLSWQLSSHSPPEGPNVLENRQFPGRLFENLNAARVLQGHSKDDAESGIRASYTGYLLVKVKS